MKITDVIFESPSEPVDRSTTKSPALGAVLKQAYAKYPSAESDIEAYIRQDMDHQQDTNQNLGTQSSINSKQSKYIDRLQDVSRKQNSEITSLDQENANQEAELEKLGRELDALEKGADLPGGRDETPTKKEPTAVQPSSGSVGSSSWAAMPASTAAKIPAPAQEPNAIKSTAAQLTAPQDPMAAMTNRITKGDSSITDKISGQAALPFEPTSNVLEPVIPQGQANPRFAAARRNASDADPKYYADVARKVASSPEQFAAAMGGVKEGEQQKGADYRDPKEVDYDDPKWDAMVGRVKKLAGLGPLKTVWDPQKRVYKNVPTAVQPKK